MTRLTETLCKAGGARNPQKNLKKFINYTVISNQNRKIRQPNVLGNRVLDQSPKSAGGGCRDEMLLMMACWKRNEFRENTCNEEFNNFGRCMSQVREKVVKAQKFADSDTLGNVSSDGRMNAKQTNKLLQMYKQPSYNITLTHGTGLPQKRPIVFQQHKEDLFHKRILPKLYPRPCKQNKK